MSDLILVPRIALKKALNALLTAPENVMSISVDWEQERSETIVELINILGPYTPEPTPVEDERE